MPNKHLKQPQVIDDLILLRQRFSGDKLDLQEIEEKEGMIKEALLKLSISGNDGIKMLKVMAREELHAIYDKMLKKPAAFNDLWLREQMYNAALEEVWKWFLGFFESAEQTRKIVKEFVEKTLADQRAPTEDPDY